MEGWATAWRPAREDGVVVDVGDLVRLLQREEIHVFIPYNREVDRFMRNLPGFAYFDEKRKSWYFIDMKIHLPNSAFIGNIEAFLEVLIL